MPLVINSYGGGRTHTHTYRLCGLKQFQETRCAPAEGRRAPGLKSHIGAPLLVCVHGKLFTLIIFYTFLLDKS